MVTVVDFSESYHRDFLRFFQAVMDELGHSLDLNSKDRDLQNIRSAYVQDRGCFLLAVSDEQVVGSVGIRKLTEGVAELKRLYVLSKYRGKGIGRYLCQEALGRCTGHFRSVRLDTTTRSRIALALFEDLGFEEIPRYNDDPYAELFYELQL